MQFLDTSAVGRLLVRDVGSDELRELLASDEELFGSKLLITELLRTAARNGVSFSLAERLIRRLELLPIDDGILREAGHLSLLDLAVRSGDAIHVVSALRMELTDFVTYDRRQAAVAEAVGLVIRAPGLPQGWWRSETEDRALG